MNVANSVSWSSVLTPATARPWDLATRTGSRADRQVVCSPSPRPSLLSSTSKQTRRPSENEVFTFNNWNRWFKLFQSHQEWAVSSCDCSVRLDEGWLQFGHVLHAARTNSIISLHSLALASCQIKTKIVRGFHVFSGEIIRGTLNESTSLSFPSLVAFWASVCDRIANSSCSCRVTLKAAHRRSAEWPIVSLVENSATAGS